MKATDYAVILALAVYALFRLPDWQPPGEAIADAASLIHKFERTIFESEFGEQNTAIQRWERDVVIGVTGNSSAHYLPYVSTLADHLGQLTGRNIHAIDLGPSYNIQAVLDRKSLPRAPEPNFFVFLTPHENMAETMDFVPGARQKIEARTPIGYGAGGGLDREFAIAFAAVSNDFPPSQVRETLLEEISQGFGPINDTEIVQPSIWSDTNPSLDRLPLNDQIILRALYDPAIRPGMPKDVAMAVVRDLIPRLVEAVRRDGEAALYQQ